MGKGLEKIGIVSAILAFFICLAGGIWILANAGFQTGSDAIWSGIGLYCIGKAFFVGPMLLITALRGANS
ncbi:MAG: hypothetical protein ACYS0I_01735 [Planctomycetota bacterium]|jgi:hypothetical protein